MKYQPTAAELARRAEEQALRTAASLFRVLSADLEALRHVAADTMAEFAVTITIPAEFVVGTGSAAEVEAQNRELKKALVRTREQIHAIQHRGETERLKSYLAGLAEVDIPASPPPTRSKAGSVVPSAGETGESLHARAEAHLAGLAPGAQLSERALQLSAAIASASPELARLVVRDLQTEIGQINREAKHREALAVRLQELDIRAGVLDHPELLREVLFVRGDPAGITEKGLDELEKRIADEEQRVESARSRRAARDAMERALLAEGYEVLNGFDVAVPHDGVLVRKPGLNYHAWHVAVGDESIHMEVVRTALDADPGISKVRDVEAETHICADLPALLTRVADSGVEIGRIRRLEPGDVPVKVLHDAKPAESSASSVQAPKERLR